MTIFWKGLLHTKKYVQDRYLMWWLVSSALGCICDITEAWKAGSLHWSVLILYHFRGYHLSLDLPVTPLLINNLYPLLSYIDSLDGFTFRNQLMPGMLVMATGQHLHTIISLLAYPWHMSRGERTCNFFMMKHDDDWLKSGFVFMNGRKTCSVASSHADLLNQTTQKLVYWLNLSNM